MGVAILHYHCSVDHAGLRTGAAVGGHPRGAANRGHAVLPAGAVATVIVVGPEAVLLRRRAARDLRAAGCGTAQPASRKVDLRVAVALMDAEDAAPERGRLGVAMRVERGGELDLAFTRVDEGPHGDRLRTVEHLGVVVSGQLDLHLAAGVGAHRHAHLRLIGLAVALAALVLALAARARGAGRAGAAGRAGGAGRTAVPLAAVPVAVARVARALGGVVLALAVVTGLRGGRGQPDQAREHDEPHNCLLRVPHLCAGWAIAGISFIGRTSTPWLSFVAHTGDDRLRRGRSVWVVASRGPR